MEMTSRHIEQLEEINKISSESAASAFSSMIQKDIRVSFSNIHVDHINNVNEILKDSISSQSILTGDVRGDLLIIFERTKGFSIIDMMYFQSVGTIKEVTNDVEVAFNELLNVIGGAYISAIANYFKIVILPKPPSFITDFGYLHDILSNEVKSSEYNILMSKVELSVNNENIEGKIIMLLDSDSLKKVHNFLS